MFSFPACAEENYIRSPQICTGMLCQAAPAAGASPQHSPCAFFWQNSVDPTRRRDGSSLSPRPTSSNATAHTSCQLFPFLFFLADLLDRRSCFQTSEKKTASLQRLYFRGVQQQRGNSQKMGLFVVGCLFVFLFSAIFLLSPLHILCQQ